MEVERLSVTPVKGLGLHHPEYVDVDALGVAGDRALFLVQDDGELISCTELGELMRHRAEYDPSTGVLDVYGPEGLLLSKQVVAAERMDTDFYGLRVVPGHRVPEWDEFFSTIAGTSVKLVLGDSGGFDVAGMTLLGTTSTEALAERNAAEAVDGRRFRMNVEFSGAEAHQEDEWRDRELALGDVVVRVGGPVKRCAATTRNPDSGDVDLKTLRMIGGSRGRQETPEFGKGFYFGVYADVLVPGRIHRGDQVVLFDAEPVD